MLCVLIILQVHVRSSSEIASHCSVFALSDSTNPDLQQQCSHKHEGCCEQCESWTQLFRTFPLQ